MPITEDVRTACLSRAGLITVTTRPLPQAVLTFLSVFIGVHLWFHFRVLLFAWMSYDKEMLPWLDCLCSTQ